MSATAQRMAALDRANEVQRIRAEQKAALIGRPAPVVAAALIDPTPELATYKLRNLFAPAGGHAASVIHRTNTNGLRRALLSLSADPNVMRLNWHTELTLRDLTREQRKQLVDALAEAAPTRFRDELTTPERSTT